MGADHGAPLRLSTMDFFSSHLSDFSESVDRVCEQSARVNFPGKYQPALLAARLKAYVIAVSVGEFPYTSVGCYPRFAFARDGAVICPKCCREEISSIMVADNSDGWLLVGDEINYEGLLYCDHCSEKIPSAYGEGSEDNGEDN
jgi:hypothetical protein